VPGGRPGAPEQALADVERRDGVAEADLHRPGGPLPHHPPSQRLPLGGARRDGEEVVPCAVGACHGGALAGQALDHAAHLPRRRVEVLMVGSAHAPVSPPLFAPRLR
jgi:hypothetical protein